MPGGIDVDPSKFSAILKEIRQLLEADLPSIGELFPKINGPKVTDHVCVVGAGPSGIHMALSLRDRGYKSIRIFEKTGRVGGKSYDTILDGDSQSQGSTFVTPEYVDNFIALAMRYNVSQLHPIPDPGVSYLLDSTSKRSSCTKK